MIRALVLLAIAGLSLLAARGHHHRQIRANWHDKDLDGVLDRYDRCPNTPFFAIVDKRGCTIKRPRISPAQRKALERYLSRRP